MDWNNPTYEEMFAAWGENLESLRGGGMGTPKIYQDALDGCSLVASLFRANEELLRATVIPQFDIVLDLSPMLFEREMLEWLGVLITDLSCESYPFKKVWEARQRLNVFQEFYCSLEIGCRYKQTELKKLFENREINFSEPTRLFYVWSNFGLMERDKVSNRIFLTPTGKLWKPKEPRAVGGTQKKIEKKVFPMEDILNWTNDPDSNPELEAWFQENKDKFRY